MRAISTIYEIAEVLKISPATVSRAISGKGYVSKELRDQILKVAKEMEYQPNSFARGLLNKRSYTIGLVIPDITNPFFPAVARGVEDVAQRNGYTLILCNSDDDLQKETNYLETLRSKQIDGVIYITSQVKAPHIKKLIKAEIPVVLGDRAINIDCDFVAADNVEGAYQATRHLLGLGHTAIGIITGPLTLNTSRERLLGYQKALLDSGIQAKDSLVVEGDFRQNGGYLAARQLFNQAEPPTALFVSNDLMALGALMFMEEERIAVPDRVALVSYDDTLLASATNPKLTTVAQPKYEIGSIACELLLERINDKSRPRQQVVLKPKLIVRESSVCRNRMT